MRREERGYVAFWDAVGKGAKYGLMILDEAETDGLMLKLEGSGS